MEQLAGAERVSISFNSKFGMFDITFDVISSTVDESTIEYYGVDDSFCVKNFTSIEYDEDEEIYIVNCPDEEYIIAVI